MVALEVVVVAYSTNLEPPPPGDSNCPVIDRKPYGATPLTTAGVG